MSFDSGKLTTNPVDRIRLVVGDISPDWDLLDDSIYEYSYYNNNQDEMLTAIDCLENIINYYALNPTDETFGDVDSSIYGISTMEKRLKALKMKQGADKTGTSRIPIMIRGNKRKDWKDFNGLFGGE